MSKGQGEGAGLAHLIGGTCIHAIAAQQAWQARVRLQLLGPLFACCAGVVEIITNDGRVIKVCAATTWCLSSSYSHQGRIALVQQ
jgi:hypothetical protein